MHPIIKLILTYPILGMLAIFATLLLCFEIGQRLRRAADAGGEDLPHGLGLIEGGIFALLGLLIAFTFAGSASRFEDRRTLIVEEANAIGTAYLRVDLLPAEVQPRMRDAFERYRAARIEAYRNLHDEPTAIGWIKRGAAIQQEIWAIAVEAGARPDAPTWRNQLLLPALNQMFDISVTRGMKLFTHTPNIVYLALWVTALVAALIAGFGMNRASSVRWFHTILFAAVVTGQIYINIDFEYPRAGIISVEDFESRLESVFSN